MKDKRQESGVENTNQNKWLNLEIKADPLLVESISDFLMGVIEAGVETGAKDEPSYGTVNAYIQKANLSEAEVTDILARVSSYLKELSEIFSVSLPSLSSSMFNEEDWGKTWKEHFKPFAILPDLIIAPSWEEYSPAENEMVITMDPGMAFGTGHHATTCLSLGLLQDSLSEKSGGSLLDVGTGTGILGMAALLFGADKALGLDNDPDAVSAAEENVARNFLQERMTVSLAPLSSLTEVYELVVANIVHDVLVSMVAELSRLTTIGGSLILSGILAGEQVTNIISVFSDQGFRLVNQKQKDEWAALHFVKCQRSSLG